MLCSISRYIALGVTFCMLFFGVKTVISDDLGPYAELYELLPNSMHTGARFLVEHMPEKDRGTISSVFLAEHIQYAYKARDTYSWAADIPKAIFLNYALPYANLDETREQWMEKLFADASVLVADAESAEEAVLLLNETLFSHYGVVYSRERPKACQSPGESIAAQKASCTGLSILLVNACRAIGIPARVVGTPLWLDRSGNHTWVEVFVEDEWKFVGAAEPGPLNEGWFVNKASQQQEDVPIHSIYAASFKTAETYFPLPWNRQYKSVPAFNVTRRYTQSNQGPLSVADIEKALADHSLENLLESDAMHVAVEDLDAVSDLVWQAYVTEVKQDEVRQQEHAGDFVTHGDIKKRYAYTKVGEKPAEGYPLYIALHGGGGTSAGINDIQWQQMQSYYLSGLTNGIYAATRGVTDTWNLHFVHDSYPLYDRLIQNMIVFEGVDPNRVYIMGYSAGGDGVYQIGARMPDRWAGAAMSAGHHNNVSPVNYANLPLLIQMGARDTAYNRNKAAAEYAVQLRALRSEAPDLYRHDAYLHVGRGHGIMDRDGKGRPQQIYADYEEWLDLRDEARVTETNTYSIHWLEPFVRNPLPKRVIWDSATTTRYNGNRSYWIEGEPKGEMEPGQARIDVHLLPQANAIQFDTLEHPVTIFLNQDMLDLSKTIKIHLPQGQTLTTRPKPNLQTLVHSVLDRGDPSYLFPVKLNLYINPEGDWVLQ